MTHLWLAEKKDAVEVVEGVTILTHPTWSDTHSTLEEAHDEKGENNEKAKQAQKKAWPLIPIKAEVVVVEGGDNDADYYYCDCRPSIQAQEIMSAQHYTLKKGRYYRPVEKKHPNLLHEEVW